MPETTWIATGKPEAPKKSDQLFAWIKAHRDAVIGGAAVLVAGALLGAFLWLNYSKVSEAAWAQLFRAQQEAAIGRVNEATAALNSIETNYSRTTAARYAVMFRGDLYFRQEKFAEAAAEYAKVVARGDKRLAPLALYSQGKSFEAAGDQNAASGAYKDFLARYPEHFMAPETHFSLARTYEALKNEAEAKSAYEKIALLYPQTSWAMMAKAILEPPKAAPKK